MLDAGLERKVVQKSGSYFSFEDERLGQGRQNATAFLREHPDVTPVDPPADPGAARRRPDRLRAAAAGRRAGRPGDGREEEGGGRGCRRGEEAEAEVEEPVEVEACRRGAAGDVRAEARSTAPSGRSPGATTPRRRCGRSSTRAGVSEDAQTDALETLERAGYVDDARFARDRAAHARRAGLRRRVDPRRPRARRASPPRRPSARSPASSPRPSGPSGEAARLGGGPARGPHAGPAGLLRGDARSAARAARCRRRRRSRIEKLHLTFCLHTTHFRIESNPCITETDVIDHARDGFTEALRPKLVPSDPGGRRSLASIRGMRPRRLGGGWGPRRPPRDRRPRSGMAIVHRHPHRSRRRWRAGGRRARRSRAARGSQRPGGHGSCCSRRRAGRPTRSGARRSSRRRRSRSGSARRSSASVERRARPRRSGRRSGWPRSEAELERRLDRARAARAGRSPTARCTRASSRRS